MTKKYIRCVKGYTPEEADLDNVCEYCHPTDEPAPCLVVCDKV